MFSFDSTLCKWQMNFSQGIIFRYPPHSSIIFDLQATTLILTLTLIFDLLNPKSIGFDRQSRTITVQSFKSFRSVVYVLSR